MKTIDEIGANLRENQTGQVNSTGGDEVVPVYVSLAVLASN